MVNWKSKYLQMKLNYINSQHKLGNSIDIQLNSSDSDNIPKLLSAVADDFMNKVVINLLDIYNIDVRAKGWQVDHVCWRCLTMKEYVRACIQFEDIGSEKLVEGIIGNRPITTYRFSKPLKAAGFEIECLEIPAPKEGSYYPSGLEHCEFVITQENDDMLSSRPLDELKKEYPSVKFKHNKKDINSDLTLKFDDGTSAKFHSQPLSKVIKFEIDNNLVERIYR
jgi:predicted metalloenzyme YecM